MRQSHHLGLTLKDDPKEAQTPGHTLLLRAGYIRQVDPGIHACMPFLLRVLDNIGGLLRAELPRDRWPAVCEARVKRDIRSVRRLTGEGGE